MYCDCVGFQNTDVMDMIWLEQTSHTLLPLILDSTRKKVLVTLMYP